MTYQPNHEQARGFRTSRVGFPILLFIFGGWFVLAALGALLSLPDLPRKSDALVLLSGGDQARESEIARLYDEGYAEKVILTDARGQPSGNQNDTIRDIEKLGIPISSILVTPGQSDSTYDEARHVLELMDTNNLGAVIVVTDPYHVFRTRMIFRGEFRQSGKALWIRSAQQHWYKSYSWMFSLRGWEMTIKEVFKIGVYLIGIKGG